MKDSQKIFCEEYLIDLNATRAYKVVHPNVKDETARVNACKLLTNANVQEYIQELVKEREERTKVTQDMVVQELAKIAFFNIKDIYDEKGKLKQVNDMNDNTTKAISSIKVKQNSKTTTKDMPIEHIPEQMIEVKTNDKVKALELLGRHLGIFKDKIEVSEPTEKIINEVNKYVEERMKANE